MCVYVCVLNRGVVTDLTARANKKNSLTKHALN